MLSQRIALVLLVRRRRFAIFGVGVRRWGMRALMGMGRSRRFRSVARKEVGGTNS